MQETGLGTQDKVEEWVFEVKLLQVGAFRSDRFTPVIRSRGVHGAGRVVGFCEPQTAGRVPCFNNRNQPAGYGYRQGGRIQVQNLETDFRSCKMYYLFIFGILINPFATIHACFLTAKWDIYIANAISNEIRVHVKSGDDDLGSHLIAFNENYHWSFCERFDGRTLFYGYFWWGSKSQSLALYDENIRNICSVPEDAHQHCYWLVRTEGLFVYNSSAGLDLKMMKFEKRRTKWSKKKRTCLSWSTVWFGNAKKLSGIGGLLPDLGRGV
ncbi:hypothetical protein OSB04_031916 [Centaurea solstitialis]|uniref:S-protein homolog n=1 Tax=Centaurea solstitialis TaxID=347529 RepID=A0AA38SVK4_9ASTR|nr:hypothetical protein OSB04_031916 [Centaurea solstitialis]